MGGPAAYSGFSCLRWVHGGGVRVAYSGYMKAGGPIHVHGAAVQLLTVGTWEEGVQLLTVGTWEEGVQLLTVGT